MTENFTETKPSEKPSEKFAEKKSSGKDLCQLYVNQNLTLFELYEVCKKENIDFTFEDILSCECELDLYKEKSEDQKPNETKDNIKTFLSLSYKPDTGSEILKLLLVNRAQKIFLVNMIEDIVNHDTELSNKIFEVTKILTLKNCISHKKQQIILKQEDEKYKQELEKETESFLNRIEIIEKEYSKIKSEIKLIKFLKTNNITPNLLAEYLIFKNFYSNINPIFDVDVTNFEPEFIETHLKEFFKFMNVKMIRQTRKDLDLEKIRFISIFEFNNNLILGAEGYLKFDGIDYDSSLSLYNHDGGDRFFKVKKMIVQNEEWQEVK